MDFCLRCFKGTVRDLLPEGEAAESSLALWIPPAGFDLRALFFPVDFPRSRAHLVRCGSGGLRNLRGTSKVGPSAWAGEAKVAVRALGMAKNYGSLPKSLILFVL